MKRHYTNKQEITPGMHPSGVFHGPDAQVLVQYTDRLLVWRPGNNQYWGGSRVYIRAKLEVLAPVTGWGVYPKTVFEGRWSKKRLAESIDRIHKLLGLPLGTIAPGEIDKSRTLVVEKQL